MNLEVGPELDALVAERVMGLKPVPGIWPFWKPQKRWEIFDPILHGKYTDLSTDLVKVCALPSGEVIEFPPPYSHSIEFAFQVVKRMREDGFSFKLWQPSPVLYDQEEKLQEHSVVSFVCGMGPCEKHGNPIENHHGAYSIEGRSAAHAISKAALVALKIVSPEGVPHGPG